MWGAVSKRVAAGLRAGVVSLALAINLAPPRACAESEAPRNEFFTGFEASDNYASAYLGGGYAFGKGLYAPGWRLRSVASYGRYRYDDTLPVGVDTCSDRVRWRGIFRLSSGRLSIPSGRPSDRKALRRNRIG